MTIRPQRTNPSCAETRNDTVPRREGWPHPADGATRLKKIVALDPSMSDTFQDEIEKLTKNQSAHDVKRLRMLS